MKGISIDRHRQRLDTGGDWASSLHFGLLRTFIAVAELKSVTRAARSLHIAQSAVSTQMTTLARLSGLSLVERRGGELTLTREGREFYEGARAVVHSVALLRDVVEKARGRESFALSAAGPRVACDVLVGSVLAHFLREHPEVRFTSQTINPRDVPSMLSTGDVDFLLVEQLPKGSPFTFRPLLTDHISLVVHPDDPLAKKSVIQPLDLLELKIALPPAGHLSRSLIEDQLGLIVSRLNVIAEIDSTPAIIQCIESGLCAGFISENMVVDAREKGSVVVRDVEGLALSRTFGILTDPQRVASPALECFLHWLDDQQRGS